jgi:hypothetical protein
MLLVILGAGASYDSAQQLRPTNLQQPIRNSRIDETLPNEIFRPPLASQLFDTREIFETMMQRFDAMVELVPLLRSEDIAVEERLEIFKQQADQYPLMKKKLASVRYYLQSALWRCQDSWHDKVHRGITNYGTLVHEIDRWLYESKQEVCFVTFNYDTMLERALLRCLNLGINRLSVYISWSNYSLIKLHGSVDWGFETVRVPGIPAHPKSIIDNIDKAEITNSYRHSANGSMNYEGGILFPALSIPVQTKDDFSCPDAHVQKLESLLPRVTKILTIGWRAREARFIEMLKTKLSPSKVPDLMVVSGDDKGARETLANMPLWPTRIGIDDVLPNAVLHNWGFTGLIEDVRSLEKFLREPVPGYNIGTASR